MKKIKKLYVGVLIFSMLLGMTACGCNHVWVSATCVSPQHCEICGIVEGETGSHNWLKATCTTPKKCSLCNATEGDALGHDWSPATYTKPETCSRCKETRGEKLVSASELGFNNLSSMDNKLVSIEKYNVSENGEAYVVAHSGILSFENGYKLSGNFTVENGEVIFGALGHPENYVIVNNDNITLDNGWSHISIKERVTSRKNKNFVVFKAYNADASGERWYVPYSSIDWEKGAEATDETGHSCNKLYIKQP